MTFLGDLEFSDGRSASKTTEMVLQRCLGCAKDDSGQAIGDFLDGLQINSDAFFRDIDGDWSGRPFIGEHVFKVVAAAGYEGTEHDLWTTVTGYPAPYAVKMPKAARDKKTADARKDADSKKKAQKPTAEAKSAARKTAATAKLTAKEKALNKADRHRAIKEGWAARG